LSSLACPAVQYFSTLSHKKARFSGKKLVNTKCVFGVSLLLFPETLLILGRTERDMGKNIYWSASTAPLFLSDFNETCFFSTYFLKAIKYQISRKSVTWEPRVPCGRTDRHDDGNSRFTKFRKRTKKNFKLPELRTVAQTRFESNPRSNRNT